MSSLYILVCLSLFVLAVDTCGPNLLVHNRLSIRKVQGKSCISIAGESGPTGPGVDA